MQEAARRKRENRLEDYRPYPQQQAFHAAGNVCRERLFRAGNQLGKTLSASAETAMHLTGRYPADWQGRKWPRAVVAWAAGPTSETTRDNCQRLLLGREGQRGTGMIPADCIVETSAARGVAGLVDIVTVKHTSGRHSQLKFKYYEQGREKWQGETVDFVWFDEEPPLDIYTEGLTRTNATGGMVFLTATPLLGMSDVVRRFLTDPSVDRSDTNMTIYDVLHISPEERERIIASYPPHEREARVKGIPMLGSGRVFPVPLDSIVCPMREIPRWWPQVGGLDFGWDHPTAGVRLAWDRDEDVVYLCSEYRQREQTPIMHAGALKPWGAWLPWAWPHDGLQHSKDSGTQLAEVYRSHGMNLMPEHATFEDGSNGVEAGLFQMLERMQTGRWKVLDGCCPMWLEELALYHRKDGKLVKEHEDLISASRYGMMMLRAALVRPEECRGAAPAFRPGGW